MCLSFHPPLLSPLPHPPVVVTSSRPWLVPLGPFGASLNTDAVITILYVHQRRRRRPRSAITVISPPLCFFWGVFVFFSLRIITTITENTNHFKFQYATRSIGGPTGGEIGSALTSGEAPRGPGYKGSLLTEVRAADSVALIELSYPAGVMFQNISFSLAYCSIQL